MQKVVTIAENEGAKTLHTIYDTGFDPVAEVTRVTSDTLGRKGLALAGQIAYLDDGAEKYEAFKNAHLPNNDSSQSAPSTLLTLHKSALADALKDMERLIIVGGGSYASIMNQEMVLVKEIFAKNPNAPLKEIVIIDVSRESLEQDVEAIKDVSKELGKEFRTLSIRSAFKKVSGVKFDEIMEKWGAKKRDDINAAVILTGGTFGNLEDINSTDAFPVHDVDEQMATIGEFVGIGSTVMFDHFTKIGSAENYYNSRELSAFMTNIPEIMKKYTKDLSNFRTNNSMEYGENYFSYRARSIPHARLVAHQLVAETPQDAKIKNGVEKVLTIDDKYIVMVSLYPSVDEITRRPSINTGLQSQFYVSSQDLAMHVYKKTGKPAVIEYEGDITLPFPDRRKSTDRARSSVNAGSKHGQFGSMMPFSTSYEALTATP